MLLLNFNLGDVTAIYDKQGRVLPPSAENLLFAFLNFELLLRKLAEFDEAIHDEGSGNIGKHVYLELTLLCKAASSALLRPGW